MGAMQSSADFDYQSDCQSDEMAYAYAAGVWPELEMLLEKGEQLRELVTRPSKLVLTHSVDLKPALGRAVTASTINEVAVFLDQTVRRTHAPAPRTPALRLSLSHD